MSHEIYYADQSKYYCFVLSLLFSSLTLSECKKALVYAKFDKRLSRDANNEAENADMGSTHIVNTKAEV